MEFFMKKSILASSIAAALFGMGAVGAQAMVISTATNGSGDTLIVPYFSTQSDNATLLSITNTDTQSGKAVKVRFRGAQNSDDVFDFQVFLSPTDVWTANISKGADGLSRLTTSDKSCTKPSAAVLNATPFITSRLDQRLTGDALAAGTREGYIEIIGMADIPPNSLATGPASAWAPATITAAQTDGLLRTTSVPVAGVAADLVNPLFTAIKHVAGVAPCTGSAFTNLDSTNAFDLTSAVAWGTTAGTRSAAQFGMTPLTGGLIADWSIVNTVNAAAWGHQAIALSATPTRAQRETAGSIMFVNYAPQIATATTQAVISLHSADPLFLQANTETVIYNATTQNYGSPVGVAPVFAAGYYDLPDLSTTFITARTQVANAAQAQAITDVLAARGTILNDFAVESSISGATDWVFSMPTRRYSIAMAYANITATNDGRVWNRFLNNNAAATDTTGIAAATTTKSNQFRLGNTSIVGNLICVSGARPVAYDREEQTATTTATVVVSPSTITGGVKLCGEASVMAFNNGSVSAAVRGSLTVTAADVGYAAGWATMSVAAGTAAGTVGTANYPIAGGAFQRAAFGAQGFGIFRPFR
jgi:hypothetical protein